jgi:DNA-binding MurR/RpiR family transcriptional regulator
MTFIELVRSRSDVLTETDQRLARILLDDTDVAAMLTATQIAARAEVHEASATRFAQKLGFKGYPQLRRTLQRELLSKRDAALRLEHSVARMRDKGIYASLLEDEVAALRAAIDAVPTATLGKAADLVWGGTTIYIFARGHAQSLGLLLGKRLRRYGKPVISLDGGPRDLAEIANTIGRRDVIVAFGFRAEPPLLRPMLEAAAALGARRVLVCDPLIAASNLPVDVTLAAARGRSDSEYQTLTVPMAVVNALVLTINERHARPTERALERLADLMDSFGRR